MSPPTVAVTVADTESAHCRATGTLMLVLFAATLAFLLHAWWRGADPLAWLLALSAWALHDLAGRLARGAPGGLRSGRNRGSRTG